MRNLKHLQVILFGWSFFVCPSHAMKSWFSSWHISDTITESTFILKVCLLFGVVIFERFRWNDHRSATLQIIPLRPCTQPLPPPPCLLLLYTSFPGRTPLPLLPKAASMEWAWLCDITLAPMSVGWGRGEWEGGEATRAGGFPTHGRPGQLSSDSLFCNCPHGLLSSLERR